MTDTPNRQPLWRQMQQAADAAMAAYHPFAADEQLLAAEIRALRDWIQAELATGSENEGWSPSNLIELPDLKALLTIEADRAERCQ